MRVAAEATIEATERGLSKLFDAPREEALKLPSHVRHLVGGAEAALVQLIVTWAQRTNYRRLQTFISSADNVQIIDFVRRLSGLTSALCSDVIEGAKPEIDLTQGVMTAALARLSDLGSQRPVKAFRGPSTEIVCADHIGKGAPYLLYQKSIRGGAELRSRENFRALAAWLLRHTIPAEYLKTLGSSVADPIGGMLYEIFRNTDDHALVDEQGNRLRTSIRLVKTNHFSVKPEDLIRIVRAFPPLRDYCGSLTVDPGSVQTHFFELSVLDSGLGFASRWTGMPIDTLTDADEERAVRECFGKGSTKGGSRFGEGLPHVLRILRSEQGFLRLRTGRLSFYADYANCDQSKEGAPLVRFMPPDGGLARVAGSLLTIVIPLSRFS